MSITPVQARNEIARRKANRAAKAAGQPVTRAESPELMRLTGPELQALAVTVPKQKQVARTRSAEARKHTELRKQAWAWRIEQNKLGNKVTYTAACEKFGTAPAGK